MKHEWITDIASVTIILLIALGALNINNLLSKPLKTSVPLAVVSSWSMEPTFHVGDMIVVLGAEEYHKGEIIVYQDRIISNKLIVHRVVILKEDGKYITKGDANTLPDARSVLSYQVKGKVILVIPYLGALKLLVEKIFRL